MLVNPHADALRCLGKPSRQGRRLNAGAVGEVTRSQHAIDRDTLSRLLTVEQHAVLGADSPGSVDLDRGPQALQLDRCLGDMQRATNDEVAGDALPFNGIADFLNRVSNRAQQRHRSFPAAALRPALARSSELADYPSAVPSRGAEAGNLSLEYDDLERGIGSPQLVRRP